MRINDEDFIIYSIIGCVIILILVLVFGVVLEGFPRLQRVALGMAPLGILFIVGACFGRFWK